jgi:hypothetical protein
MGVFPELPGSRWISRLIELIFYRKRRRPGLRASGPSSRGPNTLVHRPQKMMTIDLESYGSDKKTEGVFLWSNLHRRIKDGRTSVAPANGGSNAR